MLKTLVTVGPADHGRRMSLEEFDHAQGVPGYLYELGRGVVTVVDVPNPFHLAIVDVIREQLAAYRLKHRGRIHNIAAGSECKILLADLESERHPDIAIYKTPPPDRPEVWAIWIPELVIEVVSAGSEQRDYVDKAEEYLRFGVQEYWIIDAQKREILVQRRWRGRWASQTLGASDRYRTRLLPGFELACAPILQAGGRGKR